MIVLDVGEGYHILLGGLGRILVRENQYITAGEPVAEMVGGRATLDLEIRKNGEPVNPALWLSGKSMDSLAQ
jgi:septal ring factor EnvC (AmiA/AmiB activator)